MTALLLTTLPPSILGNQLRRRNFALGIPYMSDRLVSSAEPFAERVGPSRDLAGVSTYRFGYREEGTKDILSVINIPADIVELEVTADLVLSIDMSPTGDVFSVLNSANDTAMALSSHRTIETLVASAVAQDSLRLEESGPKELKVLLARLERSIALVRETIWRSRTSK